MEDYMKKIVLASNNKHKIKEFRKILSDFEIVTMTEVGYVDDIEENGNSFFENAMIKAQAVMEYLKEKGEECAVIADDSGICVTALNGAPGIYSARYSGDHDFVANRRKIIQELNGVEDRTAYFNCTLVMLYPSGEYKTVDGRVYGVITTEEVGDTSFGYDCMFLPGEIRKTFGEATEDEKNRVSHRGRALEKLKKLISEDNN